MNDHQVLDVEQMKGLFRGTNLLLTMLCHPDLHGPADRARQVDLNRATSPAYALVVLASVGAGRHWRLADLEAGHGPSLPSLRAVLQTVPSQGRPDLLLTAIDLVEAVARGAQTRPLVEQLLHDGVRAYEVLLDVVHELGWLAAQADPTIANVAGLIAREAVTAEQDWYDLHAEHP
ncbi:hypothetical protein [Nocardioides zeicaulis]|uniref:Carboxymuconolactone decarboxylase family protein n=1 Tax=Nocardioides zeicaulis TaxID=1776857 RepID=A0ABV6E492_9ACTN